MSTPLKAFSVRIECVLVNDFDEGEQTACFQAHAVSGSVLNLSMKSVVSFKLFALLPRLKLSGKDVSYGEIKKNHTKICLSYHHPHHNM